MTRERLTYRFKFSFSVSRRLNCTKKHGNLYLRITLEKSYPHILNTSSPACAYCASCMKCVRYSILLDFFEL